MKKHLFLLPAFLLFLCISCSSDDDDDETYPYPTYSIELKAGEKYIINDVDGRSLGSDDWYVATVSHAGLLTAEREGQTWIRANGHRLVNVTVVPQYYIHKPLYLNFGCNTTRLQKELGKPDEEDETYYAYYEGSITKIYLLEEGIMQGVEVWFPHRYYTYLIPYLNERYALVGGYSEGNPVAEFSNMLYLEHASMLVSLWDDYPYYVVTYFPYVHPKE